MSEVAEPIVEIKPTEQQVNPFASNSWKETVEQPQQPIVTPEPPKPAEAVTPAATDKPADTPAPTQQNEWYKSFNWENEDAAKKEITELKELKQNYKPVEEKKFANEESQKLYEAWLEGKHDEVYNYLDNSRRLERLTKAEVNKMSAEEIIKIKYQQTNQELTKDEVNFIFNKKYGVPPRPVQGDSELQEDYDARVTSWESQVKEKEQELIIDAKMAKPELAKAKTELVLPKLSNTTTPEMIEAQRKESERLVQMREGYLKTLENDYTKFNGYEIKYKDEEVEIPVSFAVTDEEKLSLRKELENFDSDAFIEQRWFNQDGSPNITQMMDDITLLRKKDAVLQKAVNEIGTKMREHYIKMRTNTNVTGSQNTAFQPKQNNGQQASPFAAGAWSEKPPVTT